jgi:hypothetical protein
MKPDTRIQFSSVPARSLRTLLLCAFLLPSAVLAQSRLYNFLTIAGYAGQQNSDGTGTNAFITKPAGSAVDGNGNVYISDFGNNTIRQITSAGVVITFAGSPGIAGSANGTNALFNGPEGLAVDGGGNVYVADSGNNTIRKITASGVVTTIAGRAGFAGSADGTGTNALFNAPAGVAVDITSNVYVADYGNHTIRKITPTGAVSTLAGSAGTFGSANGTGTNALFYEPEGIAVDTLGNVYVADTANDMIREITLGGIVTTLAGSAGTYGSANGTGTNAYFNSPQGLTVDGTGNVYVADTGNNLIRKVTALGVVTTIAGSGNPGSADGSGTNATFWGPVQLSVDGGANLYVADYFNGTVRMIDSSGVVTTLAGSPSSGNTDGSATSARFSLTQGVAVDSSSNIYVADAANCAIRKITAGVVSTLAGSDNHPGSLDASGTNAQFNAPQAIAVDSFGNVYVADTLNHTIRTITSDGMVSTLAGVAGYANNADGSGANAQFNAPQGIAVDGTGNIYVADTLNHTIRFITPSGTVSTIAGTPNIYGSTDSSTNGTALFNLPKGLAVDSATNIYVADSGNHTIRKIAANGKVTTIAGLAGTWGSTDGTNSGALFFRPTGVAVDSSGNVYVTDSGNHAIRKISPSGTNWIVSTVGGQPANGGSVDGVSTSALFFYPAGVALDSSVNMYVGDSGNNTVRYGNLLPATTLFNLAVQARPNSAIITWTTGTPSTSQVIYGLTAKYGLISAFNPALVTNHSVLLTGLYRSNIYDFQAVSQFGPVQGTATGSFSTDLTIIMTALQASYLGVWVNDSTFEDNYSQVYKYASVAPAAPSASATFTPTIITPGNYDTYIWYSEGSNRSQVAPVTISYQNGASVTSVNETVTGGQWHLLASNDPFAAGTSGFVRLSNYTGESNKIVMSDAIKWSYSSGQDIPVNGNVPAWWANYYFGTTNINSSQTAANGYSILHDYILGLSPLDPDTALDLAIAHTTGSGYKAVFSPYLGGRTYQLQTATNITHPVWQTLSNLSVTQDTNGNGVITFSGTNALRGYYRLSVQLSL